MIGRLSRLRRINKNRFRLLFDHSKYDSIRFITFDYCISDIKQEFISISWLLKLIYDEVRKEAYDI